MNEEEADQQLAKVIIIFKYLQVGQSSHTQTRLLLLVVVLGVS